MKAKDDGGVTTWGSRGVSRREFLRLGGAGLAGVTLLGVAGCGGGGQAGGQTDLTFSIGPQGGETVNKLVDRFNEQNSGRIRVTYREMPADATQHFD
jgi:multiple sugar transport system substrate-binding protein